MVRPLRLQFPGALYHVTARGNARQKIYLDQHRVLEMLAAHIRDRALLNILWQAMRRSVTWGGLYKDCERGISRGCPLSPLLGAFFLHELDQAMEQSGFFYVRFMDDILVLTPTRWKLRRAVKLVNAQLAALDLEKHPDKTFIGRIEKGFDFLGYHFRRKGLAVAEKTLTNFVERLTRLYEQGHDARNRARRLGNYVRRWTGWVQAGLGRFGDAVGRDRSMGNAYPSP